MLKKIRQLFSINIVVAITVMSFGSISAVGADKKPEYFRHLMFRETPYAPYRGIHPIDKETAKGTAHYKFTYDNQGRVTSIAHQIGDLVIAPNGNWDSFIWFSPKVTISYGSNKETHHYFNHKGEPVTVHGDVYRAEYVLDRSGKRKSLSFFNEAGEASQNGWSISNYQWGMDGEGRVIEKRFDLEGKQRPIRPSFEFYEVRMEYDPDGKLAFVHNYGLEGKPTNNNTGVGIDRIIYDLAGNFVRWHVYDKDGNAVEGNRPNVHSGEHLYDHRGNKIGLRGFDRHGKRAMFSWNEFETRMKYDAFGNTTEIKVYEEEEVYLRLITIKVADDGIRRIEARSVDKDGKLNVSHRLGGAALLQYEYGEDLFRPSKINRFDEHMKPTDRVMMMHD